MARRPACINNGRINVSDGGFAALLGGQATNNGIIAARLGFVALGAGEQATLDLSGDGFLSVAVPSSELGKLVNANGALVSNNGKILANGGTVFLSAATASNILRNAVNMGGYIGDQLCRQSQRPHRHQWRRRWFGQQSPVASAPGAARSPTAASVSITGNGINVTGKINASGKNGGTVSLVSTGDLYLAGTILANGYTGEGGEVDITANNNVSLVAATIAASGASGGGDINIGGGPHATTALADAQTLSVNSATVIRANATDNGNGGHVVLWSEGTTTATGSIYATGGPNGGNGGSIETSGATLNVNGIKVSAAAPHGTDGTWLLDPTDLIIDATLATTIDNALAGNTSVILTTYATGAPTGASLTAGEQNTSGNGDIIVNAPITWSTSAALTLSAYNNVTVNQAISLSVGSLTLTANNTAISASTAAIAINAPITVSDAGQVTLNAPSTAVPGTTASVLDLTFALGDSLSFTGTNQTTGAPLGALTINGTSYTLLNALTDSTFATGNGADTGTNDIAGIDNNTAARADSGNYALAVNVSGTGTAASPQFDAVLAGASSFNGIFEGLGHTITDLTVYNSTRNSVGLFGITGATATIRDIGLVGGTITGDSGYYNGTGALVGLNEGTVALSYADVSLAGIDNDGASLGGLVGYNAGGTITSSYATGSVTNFRNAAGGLVGYNTGTITSSYATGAVVGEGDAGGLVGDNGGGSITSSYATGAVAGTNSTGGLVGNNTAGTIMSSYWDTQTSGLGNAIGYDTNSQSGNITGLTTAQFQSGAATGLSAAFTSGQTGLYPYLTSFFPHGVQAVSGIAYQDAGATVALSGLSQLTGETYTGTVSLDANGGFAGDVTTGSDGYYYFALPAGTLANRNGLVTFLGAYDTGTITSATLLPITGATVQGANLYGNTLSAFTNSLTLSGAPSFASLQASATAAAGSDSAAAAVVAAVTNVDYLATGASFSIDVPTTVASGTSLIVTTPSGIPLTVDAAVTVADGGNLGLLSGGALRFNMPVTAVNTAKVFLTYDASNPTNLSFGSSSLTFSGGGGTLYINGQSYILVYSMAQLAGIDTVVGSDFDDIALAGNLDASGVTYLQSLIGNGVSSQLYPYVTVANSFNGIFEGLGHTITGLTIVDTSDTYVGLFGLVGALNYQGPIGPSTIRDIGLVGGSVTSFAQTNGGGIVGELAGSAANVVFSYATGTVTGSGNSVLVGGLVGQDGGTITSSYATANVSGNEYIFAGGLVGQDGGTITSSYATGNVSGGYAGGLVGNNSSTSTITSSYATGNVSSPGGGGFTLSVGGLVGNNSGTITSSYATGAVSSSRSGALGSGVGGLVGENSGGTITSSYATGAVSGASHVGGLVGENDGGLTYSYATGAVSSSGTGAGGLVGYNSSGIGIVTSSYYDATTTGQALGMQVDGSVGLTTAQLQSTATTGVTLGSAFAGGAAGGQNNVYPYLTSIFPNGVQAVSGFAYTNSGSTPLESPASGASGNALPASQNPGLVSAAANGLNLGTVTTGANGYYYIFVPAGTLAAGATVVAYTQVDTGAAPSGAANAASYATAGAATTTPSTTLVPNLNIYGGWQLDQTAATTLSALNTADATAAGALVPAGIANREIVTTASAFSLDTATSLAGTLILSSTGTVTQTSNGAISVGSLGLEGTGGAFTLTNTGNTIPTIAASTGSVTAQTSGALTVGAVGDATGNTVTGVSASATTGTPVSLMASGGGMTLTDGVTSGAAILLASDGAFTNNDGAAALTPGAGASFTVYSQDPTNLTTVLAANTLDGLTGTNWYNDAFNFTTDTFTSAVPTGGNYFVTAYAATLTPAITGSTTKGYDGTTASTGSGLIFGLPTLVNANGLTDSASASGGSATYTYGTANAGTGLTVTATGITLGSNPNNYTLGTASAAVGIITPAQLSYTIGNASQTYGTPVNLATALGSTIATGVNGETLGISYMSTGNTATANVGGYAITGTVANGTTGLASNYAVTLTNGTLTVNQLALSAAFTFTNSINKVYDGTASASGGSQTLTGTNGLINGDTITVSIGTGAYANGANVGNGETINVSSLTLTGGSSNYNLSGLIANATGSITPLAVVLSGSQTYNGTTNAPAAGLTVTNVIGNDNVGLAGTGVLAGANVGSEALTSPGGVLSGLTVSNPNYTVTGGSGSVMVNTRAITVTANAQTQTYGNATPTLTYAVGGMGLVNGDTLSGCARDFGKRDQQHRHLRDHPGHARRIEQLCGDLYRRQ